MGTKGQIKVWHLVAITAAVTILIVLGVSYHLRTVKRLSHGSIARDNVINTYRIEVDSVMEQAAEARADLVEAVRQLELTKAEKERLQQINIRRVHTIGQLQMNIASAEDSLTVYKDSLAVTVIDVPVNTPDKSGYIEVNTMPVIELPVTFGFETEWSRTFAAIDINGLGSAGFEVKSLPVNLTLGSRGVFRKDYVSVATTPNPEVEIAANNFQIVKQPRWKPVVIGTGVGVVVGVVATALLTR